MNRRHPPSAQWLSSSFVCAINQSAIPKKANNSAHKAVRTAIRATVPHAAHPSANQLPQVNTIPWQARRLAILESSALAETTDLQITFRSLINKTVPGLDTVASDTWYIEYRVLRVVAYTAYRVKTDPQASTPLTDVCKLSPNDFDNSEPTSFSTYTARASYNQLAALGFDFGLSLGSHVTAVGADRPELLDRIIATVTGTHAYVDVLVRIVSV